MSITTVVFDIGAVLLRWQPHILVEQVFPGEGKALFQHIVGHPLWSDLDAGKVEEDVAVRAFSKAADKPLAAIQYFMDETRRHLAPLPESIALFREIKQAGYRTYVLSNMHHKLIEHYYARDNFWTEFDGILYSAELQLLKPEPAIYQALFTRFNIVPTEAVFIDDMPANIQGARNMGMGGVVFKDIIQCRRDLKQLGILYPAQ